MLAAYDTDFSRRIAGGWSRGLKSELLMSCVEMRTQHQGSPRSTQKLRGAPGGSGWVRVGPGWFGTFRDAPGSFRELREGLGKAAEVLGLHVLGRNVQNLAVGTYVGIYKIF